MGSLSFKFKKPISCAYAPGRTNIGKQGEDGNPGENGSALYFIDYELNNSYIIELTQQKLENGYVLSGESEKISDTREYHIGDIIITNSGNCYRLVKGSGYYTFDITYIGRISNNIEEENKNVVRIYMCRVTSPLYPEICQGFMPNNRQFLDTSNNIKSVLYSSDTDVSEISEVFNLYGVWYKFIVTTDVEFGNNIEFTVEINLKNSKTFQMDSINFSPTENNADPTGSPLYHFLPFYKTLEFKAASTLASLIDTMSDNDKLELDNIKPVFISDMSLDKMHLFGNDIKHTVIYKNNKPYCCSGTIDNLSEITASDMTDVLQKRILPVENSEFVPSIFSVYDNANFKTAGENRINWRGGESAYFSGSDTNLVLHRIEDFLTSDENIVRVIAHNKNTHEVKVFENIKIIKQNIS